ncbi:MAG: peptidoglycan recognition family protein, partial [bacterium]|nr:peptidoglycan recognition family protein [bacterium]
MLRRFLLLFCLLCCSVLSALTMSNRFSSPRNKERAVRKRTQYIILHTTEAEAKSALRKLSRNGEAHYCVDRDGTVYRIVERSRVAYHCGTSMWAGRRRLDEVSVGIEVIGYHDRVLTMKQYTALKELIRQLQSIYGIKDANVMPHAQVAYGKPNRWHPKSHRGRKRCGMGYATPGVRKLLGLDERWLVDGDVKARRLVVGDSYLSQVLYAKDGDKLLPYKVPKVGQAEAPIAKVAEKDAAVREHVIRAGQTAWDIARDAYNAPSTIYIFPNGKRITGDKVTDWESMGVGTRVILSSDADGSPIYVLPAGGHPKRLIGNEVFSASTWYLRPNGTVACGSKLNEKALNIMPPKTQILTGYIKAGPV